MKVRIFFFIVVFASQSHLYAQNILAKDTANSISRFQFGIGGYLGTQGFTSHQSLSNLSGYDNGVFIKAIVNFNKKMNCSIDFRYFERTGVINSNYNGGLMDNALLIKADGFEIPVIVSYKFLNKEKGEIVSLRAGGSYNHINYQTTYDEIINPPPGPSTVSGYSFHQYVVSKSIDNFSLMFGVSKNFRITRRNYLCLFNEYDFSLNKFYLEDLINNPITYGSWWGDYYHFNSFCIRLGLCVIL